VQPSKIAWYTPRSWSLSWVRNNKARFRACVFSVRPQPAPQNLQEKFCKKIWDKSKKVLLWDSHTCVVKCGIFKICLLWARFRRFYTDFRIITHVRGFVIFSPTTTCSAGSSGKVLQKNLRQVQKFSALRLSLICGQMWRSSKCAYSGIILTFYVSFMYNYARFRICEFSVRAPPALQDPQESVCKKSGTRQKILLRYPHSFMSKCQKFSKYTYYGLIFDNLRRFLSFIVKYRKNTNWFNHIPIFTFLLRYQSNQERFRMCGFWVRPQPAPEKFLQKIWDKWKTFLLRDTLEFVVTCRNHQMYHLYANFKRLCKDLRRIKHILRFVIFVSDHHLLCRISRKSFAKNLRRDKKFCSDTLTHLWYNVKIVQNAYYVPILDRFVAFLTDL